ncbi:Hypothetical predicted protein [Lynx pardinus]|uniref:Uncharacterized protein n=1 Tax=Lynx pardinus TaxID=191816 RepID=A0A485NAZ8_LYNPA|nr:Hypothetical predicted protein [Lynx pardinus]
MAAHINHKLIWFHASQPDSKTKNAFGLRNAFLVQHENRYRRCGQSFLSPGRFSSRQQQNMDDTTAAISCFTKNQETKKISLFTSSAESSEM